MSYYSVKKRVSVLMGVLIVIVLGLFSLSRLPLSLFPDIELPFIVTFTTYQGANPETVESDVTTEIESIVATLEGFTSVESMSYENYAISIIEFSSSTNMDSTVVDLRENLDNVIFPEGVDNSRILRFSPDMLPVMQVSLYQTNISDLSNEDALIANTKWINEDLLTQLKSIPGIADVSLSGEADVVLEVNLDNELIANYNLDEQSILNIIEEQNTSGLAGIALDNGEIRLLYLGDSPSVLEDVENLPIIFDEGVVRLGDLVEEGGIRFINADVETYSKINLEQGVIISFQKQSDVGITEATANVIEKLDEIMEEYDQADYIVLLDQGEYINQSIGSVVQNILIGGLFAVIVLYVFLRNIRPTIIVGLAIPISVIAAFMLMYFAGVSLNIVSMGGLALAIGMLVDNAVVVIENIYRLIGEGKSKIDASIEGAKQIAGAITASTLTTVAVFLPIVFVEGFISDIFMSMAYTIAFSLAASLIIALTMVPSLSSKILKDGKGMTEGKFIHRLKDWYESSVLFTLKHKFLTLIVVFALFAGSFYIVYSKGFILLPESDEGSISITVELSSVESFELRSDYADLISEEILKLSDVETISASMGGSSFGPSMMSGSSSLELTINLRDDRSQTTQENSQTIETIIETFDVQEAGLPSDIMVDYRVDSQDSTSALSGASGINIKISGYNLLTLESIANDVAERLKSVDHVVDVEVNIETGADSIYLRVDQDQAIEYGLTNQDIQENIDLAFGNLSNLASTESVTLNIEGTRYDLQIPTDSIGDFSLDAFGSYEMFLGGIVLFDDETREMIEEYEASGENSVYLLNIFLPTYEEGEPIQFVVNPFLQVKDGMIIMDPLDVSSPTLLSLAKAPLYGSETPVTTIEKVTGFSTIYTDGSNRYVTVSAQIEDGYNVTNISSDATNNINGYIESEFKEYGAGYDITFEGESEEILDAVNDLSIAAIVAILLVYMVMAIQFQSLSYPFIILSTIPLAFTGGFMALMVTNMNLSMVSIMGLIILVGVVVNNGIVLIDYINKLIEDGHTIKASIVEAGRTRLRPILMTASTTVLALFVMALGIGSGSELLQPMAITAIGGLLYATLLTLVVVPVIFALFNHKRLKQEGAYNE